MAMMMAAVMARSAGAGLVVGPGLVDRPAPPHKMRGGFEPVQNPSSNFEPLFCAGDDGSENDDDTDGGGHQGLHVDLPRDGCMDITRPLVATWIGGGITAGDFDCDVGYQPQIWAKNHKACSTIVAAFNTRLGGSAFSCDHRIIVVEDTKANRTCWEKVAVLNAALKKLPPPPPPPPAPFSPAALLRGASWR